MIPAAPPAASDAPSRPSERSTSTSAKAAVALPEDERYVAEEAPFFSGDDSYEDLGHASSAAGDPAFANSVPADPLPGEHDSGEQLSDESASAGVAAGDGAPGDQVAGNEAAYNEVDGDTGSSPPGVRSTPGTDEDASHSAILGDPAVAMLMEVFPGRILSVEARGDEADQDAVAGGGELPATAASEESDEGSNAEPEAD